MDFLPDLSRHLAHRTSRGDMHQGDIYLQLTFDTDSHPRVAAVDAKGTPVVNYDPRQYPGPVSTMLRSLASINDDSQFNISWGTDTGAAGTDLSKYPLMVYQLVRCDNLRDARMKPIKVSADNGEIMYNIEPVPQKDCHTPADGDVRRLASSWTFVPPVPDTDADDADSGAHADGLECAGPLPSGKWQLIGDSFVLAGNTIYPIHALGENYMRLGFFATEIPASMLDALLSVAYSYVDHFTLNCQGRTVDHGREPVEMHPLIAFEQVDSDLALHMRVGATVHDVDPLFVSRFDISRVATTAVDGRVTVRTVRVRDTREDIDHVEAIIKKCAPTRKDAREVYLDGDSFILSQQVAGPFLLHGLPQLIGTYSIIGAERLKDYKVVPAKPRLNLKVSSGIDFLEGDATVEVGDETLSLGHLFEQYRRDKYITLRDGTKAVLDDQYMRRLERIFGSKRGAGKDVKISYFDLPEIDALLSAPLDQSLFARQRSVYEGFNTLSSKQLRVPQLKASLRRYQEDGIKWIKYLYDNNLGGCLADDMGLGKTIQTIGMLSTVYPAEPKPTLIVMPRSLLFNWSREIERFCPALSVYTYYQGTRDLDEAVKANVILTTYAMVRNDIEKFTEKEFHYVILDESQNIKNINAQVTRAVYLLKAPHRLALSGTPIENNLTELYSLFRFLNPGLLGELDDFNRRYAGPITRDDDREAMAALRRRIYPFMLRRLKKDVLTELPDRIEQTLYVEMERPQAEYYEQRRRYYADKVKDTIASEGVAKSQFVMFQALTELRRIASVPESLTDGEITSPKLEALVESVANSVANGHKCVVFFNYIAGLELAGERLRELGIGFAAMTGATGDRRTVVDRFTRDPECKVFLMTLKTGGVGLNLTVADTVYIFEPWWNKAAEEQAVNRLHRFGQKAKVLAYSLITRDTIEEKILLLQQQKSRLFESLIGSDTASAKHLSEDDINFILSR